MIGPQMNGGRSDDHADYIDQINAIKAWNDLPRRGDYLREQEEMHKVMDEYIHAEMEMEAEISKKNERILKAVRNQKGEDYYKCLLDFINDSEVNGAMQIVRKPKGEFQRESYGVIKNAWVEQYSVGDTGDSFEGFVSVKLKQGRWLQMPFRM
jgi:hypothetical protein